MNTRFDELAPCGVYCGACPSFGKTCKGCGSNDREQTRCSKWSCKIRTCCYDHKGLDYCIHCEEFPCKIVRKKLIDSHPRDPRFTYRHEIPEVFAKLKTLDTEKHIEFHVRRWRCKSCGGTVQFYLYKCNKCGKEKMV